MEKEKYAGGKGPRKLAWKPTPTSGRITVTNIERSTDEQKIGHNVTYKDKVLGDSEWSIFIPSEGYGHDTEFNFGPMAVMVRFYVEQQEREARLPSR